MIRYIKVNNFRQFKSLNLETNSQIVVLSGDNTKGKSTILEALHIITTGNSPWNDFSDIKHNSEDLDSILDTGFRIEIENYENIKSIYRDGNKRVLKIDNTTTNSRKFFHNQYCILFSPELIEILMISPSKRREFVDNTISHFNLEYSNDISKYNKVLKHRNAYIKRLSKILYNTGTIPQQTQELEIWTKQLIEIGLRINRVREQFFKDISNDEINLKYITSIDNENSFNEQMEKSYNKDIALGYTNVGVHRDDWEINTQKNIKRYGSRGEKRLAIISMLFSINEYIKLKYNIIPLILLDDVPSELDNRNTEIILDRIIKLNQQIFLTTIKKEYLPQNIIDNAITIDLNTIN